MTKRELAGLAGAISLGPLLQLVGDLVPSLWYAGGALFFFVSIVVIPILCLISGKLRFAVWQIAIFSIIVAMFASDLRDRAMRASELPAVAFVFWASGTVLSLPIPLYFMLRPLRPAQRLMVGGVVVIVAGALWLGVRHITG